MAEKVQLRKEGGNWQKEMQKKMGKWENGKGKRSRKGTALRKEKVQLRKEGCKWQEEMQEKTAGKKGDGGRGANASIL